MTSSNDTEMDMNMSFTHYPLNFDDCIAIGLLAFFSVLGTIGNTIVICVFLRKRDRLISTHFILVLAVVDLITCVIVIPYTIVMEVINFYIQNDLLCKLYQFLITSNIPFSALIMVAIAADRYLCICHPFLRALTHTRAKIITVLLAILAIIIGIIVALIHGVYIKTDFDTLRQAFPETLIPQDIVDETTVANYGNISQPKTRQQIPSFDAYFAQDSYKQDIYSNSNDSDVPKRYIIYYNGYCDPNTIIFSEAFRWYYQKVYTALFLICFLIVIILYSLIYQSVLIRRAKRERQKSQAFRLSKHETDGPCCGSEATLMSTANVENPTHETSLSVKSPDRASNGSLQVTERRPDMVVLKRQATSKRDKLRMANLKTAGVLFVVTIVFIVTYLPAFLMTNDIIPYNMVAFYMYFANNVANPVIYSFMNKIFRDDMRHLFCKK